MQCNSVQYILYIEESEATKKTICFFLVTGQPLSICKKGVERLSQSSVSKKVYSSLIVNHSQHSRSWIHERTSSISLRFLGIIMRVIRGIRIQCLHYKPIKLLLLGGGGGGVRFKKWLWIARRKALKTFVSLASKNSASVQRPFWFTSVLVIPSNYFLTGRSVLCRSLFAYV